MFERVKEKKKSNVNKKNYKFLVFTSARTHARNQRVARSQHKSPLEIKSSPSRVARPKTRARSLSWLRLWLLLLLCISFSSVVLCSPALRSGNNNQRAALLLSCSWTFIVAAWDLRVCTPTTCHCNFQLARAHIAINSRARNRFEFVRSLAQYLP